MPGVPLDSVAVESDMISGVAGMKDEAHKMMSKAMETQKLEEVTSGGKECDTTESGKVIDGDADEGAEADGEAKVEEPKVRLFYMVKLPRPEGDSQENEIKRLEARLNEKQEQFNYITAGLKVKQVAKSSAHSHTEAALDRLKVHSAEIRAKLDVLKPLLDKLKAQQEEVNSVRNTSRELQATSEEELDNLLEKCEYRISHEVLPIAEEKQLVRRIKQLKQSREAVREFSSRQGAVSETRNEREEIRNHVKVLKEEVDLLRMQENMQREIFKKYQDAEKAIEVEVKAIFAERQEVVLQRDEIREEVRNIRNLVRKEEGDYHKNRRLIRKLKELAQDAEKKDIEAAEQLSTEQVERVHERLATDAVFREEYFRLMQKQNPRRYIDLDDLDMPMSASPLVDASVEVRDKALAREKAKALIQELIRQPVAPPAPEPEPEEVFEPAPVEEVKAAPVKKVVKAKAVPKVQAPVAVPVEETRRSGRAPAETPVEATFLNQEEGTVVEDFKQGQLVKKQEAEERKRRSAERAAQKAAKAEAYAAENRKKKLGQKQAKKQGVKKEPEQVEPVVEDSAPEPVKEQEPEEDDEVVVVKKEPTLRRRVGKKGKVVVESASAASKASQQQMAIIALVVLAILAVLFFMFKGGR
ncbi:hypothetical protein CYMTET_25672 [Cymbomonas tetramitiformis]|uniref:Uncharacterized protein n=1 Tax=Cymbomonas tetramitiformis TaxID=36881 RepID=A0AAE0FTQ9_9CHLO|nr:hypothetical protein CYMTET_25672 [Cymbomonas tetramitiformis]